MKLTKHESFIYKGINIILFLEYKREKPWLKWSCFIMLWSSFLLYFLLKRVEVCHLSHHFQISLIHNITLSFNNIYFFLIWQCSSRSLYFWPWLSKVDLSYICKVCLQFLWDMEYTVTIQSLLHAFNNYVTFKCNCTS